MNRLTLATILAAATAVGVNAAITERRAGLARRAVDLLGLPPGEHGALARRLRPRAPRWGCGLFAALGAVALLVTVLAGDSLLATGILALILGFVGIAVGVRMGRIAGPVSAELLRIAARARHLADLDVAGTPPKVRAHAATLARLLEQLARNVPSLTLSDLERYYTPRRVAAIFTCGSEDDLEAWLDSSIEPLWESPEERSRVALLRRVRREIQAAGGKGVTDREKILRWIAELGQWSPPG